MAKSVKSYRLGDVAIAKVAAIAKERGVSESRVVEDFIMGQPEIVADNDRAAINLKPTGPGSVGGVADPAKLAAFQEKTGMTHFGKKR